MRDVVELVGVLDPAWPWLVADLDSSFADYAILPPEPQSCEAALHQLQVTARSPLGAVVLNTAGVLVHGGWLRMYGGSGGGSTGMPSIGEVNGFPADPVPGWQPAAGLIIAHDVLGGVFALNGAHPQQHGRPGVPGSVVHFSAATLTWEDLDMGHTEWLSWVVEDATSHYRDLLWPTWRAECAALGLREGISVYPSPWSDEAQQDMAATTRGAVPLEQILDMHAASCLQLVLDDPGALGFNRG
ncbi:hypothetical protein MARA_01380 (plasmid) [Mycolicibacterium arabiense]|uniref:DUF2625 domain-containing protein n=1 Tax=Mycolicibacterium arabiense TaxID=1286181 RepID=A0A7I7RQ53_9MYCO|nr:DUF2625 family protein [Mycolicibacterium arabiense]MCV7371973.1 DUF2625 family protein [Mycolicibacterium arabiense]BBY46708.1 hypothetical protein MARA_01380 [Mycolicibacterium arabiense]